MSSPNTVGEAAREICNMIERRYPDSESNIVYIITDYFDRKYKTGIYSEEE